MKEKVTIYTATSGQNVFYQLKDIFRGMWEGRELAFRLAVRNIKGQYRDSLLGYFWAVLPPVITASIWIFLRGSKIVNISDTDIPYPAFVIIGTVLWQSFVSMLLSPIQSFNASKSILSKINFQREALILAGVGEALFNFAIRFVLIIIVLLVFQINPGWNFVLGILAVLLLLLHGLTLGLLLTPFSILYGDVQKAVTTFTAIWMFLTPVIYPEPKGGAKIISQLNPVSPLLSNARSWLTGGESGNMTEYFVVGSLTVIVLMFALILFRLSMPHLISRIGS